MRVLSFPILLTSVIIPIILSMLLYPLGRRLKPKALAAISAGSLLIPLAVTSYYSLTFEVSVGVIDPVYFTHPSMGSFTMLLDSLSAPLVFSIALVTTLVSIYSITYMEHRFEEMKHEGLEPQSWGTYYMLYTMFSAAMMGTVLSTNLIEFYIFLELTLIPSFLLIAFYGYGERVRIAIMYLIWTHVGALAFLLGVSAIGLTTGTFDILNVRALEFNVGLGQRLPEYLVLPAAIAIILGLLVKMAIFGVHIWLPYAHAEAPTPVSALLSPNLIGIAGYALIRIVFTLFPAIFQQLSTYFIILAIITMIYGGFTALAQDDFKRLLAYSSISQMGYILLGISTITSYGFTGAILHYVSHAVGKAVLFMVAGILIVQLHGLRSISRMGGLAARMPVTGSLALIGFMHITGIPPALGLWSEVLIVFGVIERALRMGSVAFTCLVSGLVVAIGLSTAYAFITMKRIFFGEISEKLKGARDGGASLMVTTAIIAAAGLILFFYPNIFIDPLISFTREVFSL